MSLIRGGVSSADSQTLKYLKYNPDTNELEATRTITTEPATIKVGNHSISSMGENFGFTNLTTNIVWHPAWTGLKDQSLPANHGATGVIPPTFRHYNSDTIDAISNGTAETSGAVDYVLDSILPITVAAFGQSVVVAEDVVPDDWLFYVVRFGDSSTPPVYQQILTGLTLAAGDLFRWDFEHPLEGRAGQELHTTMHIAKSGQDNEKTLLQVRPGTTDPLVRWGTLHYRTYTDEDVVSGTLFTTASQVIRYAATYAVDTAAGAVNLTVDDAIGYKSFVVFDASQNFNVNACTINFGATQGDAVLQQKNDSYLFYYDGNQWRYLDMNTKNGGIV